MNPLVLAILLSADASQMTVTAQGSNTPRTLADRSADVVNVLDFGADPTGTVDASAALTAAMNAGKKNVLIPAGDFRILSTVTVPSGVRVFGLSWASRVFTPNDIEMFRTEDHAAGVTFENVTLEKTGTSSRFHIVGVNPLEFTVRECQILGPPGFTFAGIAVTDGTFTDSSRCGPGSFMSNIHDNVIAQGSILLAHSDSRIVKNYVWASESTCNSAYAIRIQNTGNVLVADNDIVPSCGYGGGVFVHNAALLRIFRNFFDGSYDTVLTGSGVAASSSTDLFDTQINDNTFWNLKKGGILLPHFHNGQISHNVFQNNNRLGLTGNGDSDLHVGNALYSTSGVFITDNNFLMNESRANKGFAISLPRTGANRTDAVVARNSIVGAGYLDNGTYGKIEWPGRNAGTSTLRDNFPMLKMTGSVTIPAGQSAGYVRWGCAMPLHTANPSDLDVRFYTPGVFPPAQWRVEALNTTDATCTHGGFNVITNGNVASDSTWHYTYEVR